MTWKYQYPKAVVHDVGSVPRPAWAKGKPINILNHFTATCGATWPGEGRFASEGIGSPFGIKRDGTVCQYVDLTASTWHAYNESLYGVGIELDASPTTGCLIETIQLEALAQLNAWLCKTFAIPAKRAPGAAFTTGIKCHTDGLEPGGTWDPNGHYDAPWKATGDPIAAWIPSGTRGVLDRSPRTSAQFIDRVAEILKPPPSPPGGDDLDMTKDELAQALGYASAKDWRTQEMRAKADSDVLGGRAKRAGQDPAYDQQYDAAKLELGG